MFKALVVAGIFILAGIIFLFCGIIPGGLLIPLSIVVAIVWFIRFIRSNP